jgi:hypothetical protein
LPEARSGRSFRHPPPPLFPGNAQGSGREQARHPASVTTTTYVARNHRQRQVGQERRCDRRQAVRRAGSKRHGHTTHRNRYRHGSRRMSSFRRLPARPHARATTQQWCCLARSAQPVRYAARSYATRIMSRGRQRVIQPDKGSVTVVELMAGRRRGGRWRTPINAMAARTNARSRASAGHSTTNAALPRSFAREMPGTVGAAQTPRTGRGINRCTASRRGA